MTTSRRRVLLALILILAGFFRFHRLEETPPGLYPDEAMNGNNALEALATGRYQVFYPENNGREGLFINLQALSIRVLGNTPFALRAVAAVLGTLTVLGVSLAGAELFASPAIGLVAAGLTAASYWHVNFSRIGLRAITTPLFSSFAIYLLLRGRRRRTHLDLLLGGIVTGLGFYGYIAFRFVPLVMLVPLLWWLADPSDEAAAPGPRRRAAGGIAVFGIAALVVALPLGVHFLAHPDDFTGRSDQVSVLAAAHPLRTFAESNLLTLGMLFTGGDTNWRHNLPAQPEIDRLAAFLFLAGVATLVFRILTRRARCPEYTLVAWLLLLSLPATLTLERLPHALRSIGMVPPVFLIAGLGADQLVEGCVRGYRRWRRSRADGGPSSEVKPRTSGPGPARVRAGAWVTVAIAAALHATFTYRTYFDVWAARPETRFVFATDLWLLGQHLAAEPADTEKYVVVNLPGVPVRGIPVPAQTIMYATDTFREDERTRKHLTYLIDTQVDDIALLEGREREVVFLRDDGGEPIARFRVRHPGLRESAIGPARIFSSR